MTEKASQSAFVVLRDMNQSIRLSSFRVNFVQPCRVLYILLSVLMQ
jgi:hypothetical protein